MLFMDDVQQSWRQSKLLAAVVVGGFFYLVGQYIASQPQRVQEETEAQREVTIEGSGEVEIRPDVGRITLGVQTGVQVSAAEAMRLLAERFNAVVAAVRGHDVKEDDIRTTNLSVNPVYDYFEGRQTLRGFEASESVEVTIRDLAVIGAVVTAATQAGANQTGGIRFEVDNLEAARLEAQAEALKDAQRKAVQLADALGVRLGRVKTFVVTGAQQPPMPIFAREASAEPGGLGGDIEVPTGTNTITAAVSVTYELR